MDTAGDEASGDCAMFFTSETSVSFDITSNNTDFRVLVQEIVSPKDASNADMFKRSSKQNSEFLGFLCGQRQLRVIRLLCCAHDSRSDLVAKTGKVMPEI